MIETLSLAALIDRFAHGLQVYDASFARTLAAALDAHAGRIRLPAIDALGLTDVMVTFRLDGGLALVVTGGLESGPGEVTVHFDEAELPELSVTLHGEPRDSPYLFATLDHSWRGRPARLVGDGEIVEVRALTTIGAQVHWRVRAADGSRTVLQDELTLLDDD